MYSKPVLNYLIIQEMREDLFCSVLACLINIGYWDIFHLIVSFFKPLEHIYFALEIETTFLFWLFVNRYTYPYPLVGLIL